MSETGLARRSAVRAAGRVLLAAAGLAALGFALKDASWQRTRDIVASIGPPVAVLVVPQGLQILLHALAWRQLLAGLGARRSPWAVFALFLGAEAVRMTLPAGPAAGETLSIWLLRSRYDVDIGDAVASVATKKLLVVATNAVYAGLALALLLASPRPLRLAGLGEHGLYWIIVGSIATLTVIATAMVVGMVSGGLATRFGRLVARLPLRRARDWAASKAESWRRADEQLAQPMRRERLGALVVPALLLQAQWFLEAGETWLILHLCGADVGVVPALTIEVCASLLRSAAFAVPGGYGVQDAGYVALLGAFGVPDAPSLGAAFVLLKRGKELVWIAAGYVILGAWGARPSAAKAEP